MTMNVYGTVTVDVISHSLGSPTIVENRKTLALANKRLEDV